MRHGSLDAWMKARLRAAKAALVDAGVPRRILRSSVRIEWLLVDCGAYVREGDPAIHVCGSWATFCYWRSDAGSMEYVLRHELGHLISERSPGVRKAFRLPGYPSELVMWTRYLRARAGLIEYGQTHPEEAFAERVASLSPRTVRRLVAVLRATSAR